MNDTKYRLPAHLTDVVVGLDDELYDELLYEYPTPAEADRDEMPVVRVGHDGAVARGIILGYGTSFEESHRDHAPGTLPTRRCSGCRWTDVTIMWAQPHDPTDDCPLAPWQYCVIVRGRSELPGETQRVRTTWTPDAHLVLDALNVPIPKHLRVTGRERSVAGPHEEALLDAALLDEPLSVVADEYVARRDREDARWPTSLPGCCSRSPVSDSRSSR